MRIVIAGGSGFLGRPLAAALAADGHDVVILTRGDGPRRGQTRSRAVAWTPDGDSRPVGRGDRRRRRRRQPRRRVDRRPALDAPRRSSGSSTAACAPRAASSRRSQARRSAAAGLRQRIGGRLLRPARRRGRHRGRRRPAPISSRSVCVQWEAEAMRAASDRTRVVCIRTGLVLERDGGALPQMLPPFRFGAGGPVGSGRQYWPWIHRADWIDAGAVGDPDAGGGRAAQRDRAEPGDQRRVRARARPRACTGRPSCRRPASRCG